MKVTIKQFFKVLFLFKIIILSAFIVKAQPCIGSTHFQNQSQIDSFNLLNTECTIIQGDLILSGSDITNIDSLYNIIEITGGLRIQNTRLKELKGLSKVKSLRYISLRSNDSLSNISNFDSLVTIKDSLKVVDCPALASISVFPILRTVDYIEIKGRTDKLKEIIGFDSLRFINNAFVMENNFGVEVISGFQNVCPVNFVLSENRNLKTVIGFNGFIQFCSDTTSVLQDGVFFQIFRNDSLNTFEGLHNVECFGRFHIWENFLLRNVNVAENTKKVADFSVQFNFMLDKLVGFNKVYTIHSNGVIDINNNDSLNQIHIFKELRKVHRLIISDTQAKSFNESFINLDTISNLRNVGSLELLSNRKLTDISVFNDLKYTDEVIILNNRLLGECSLESICKHIKEGRLIEVWITNYPGCRSVNQILAKCTVSTSDDNSRDLVIYPNPSYDQITVQQSETFVKSSTVAIIYDITGKELMRKTIDWTGTFDSFTIDISDLANGSYQVIFWTSSDKQTARFVKI